MKVRGEKSTSDSFGNAEIHCTEKQKKQVSSHSRLKLKESKEITSNGKDEME